MLVPQSFQARASKAKVPQELIIRCNPALCQMSTAMPTSISLSRGMFCALAHCWILLCMKTYKLSKMILHKGQELEHLSCWHNLQRQCYMPSYFLTCSYRAARLMIPQLQPHVENLSYMQVLGILMRNVKESCNLAQDCII